MGILIYRQLLQQLNDSTVIISILQSFLLDQKEGIQKFLRFYQPVKSKNDDGKPVSHQGVHAT